MADRKRSQAAGAAEEQNAAGKNNPAPAGTSQETKETRKDAAGTGGNGQDAAKKDTGPVMYVGPTVTGFAIQNRVYTEIPEEAQGLITAHPELRNLFLPIREYPKANRMIREGTGYIYSAYLVALTLRR